MMISNRIRRIFLICNRIDGRKQHDGLLAEAFKMNLDPFRGDAIIFVGRARRRIRALYADSTGLWLSTKKFTNEAMKTNFRFLKDPTYTKITQGELAMFMEGSSYTIGKSVSPYLE